MVILMTNEAIRFLVALRRREAQREIARHGLAWDEFVADCGDSATYSGQTVLDWLGY